MRGTARHLLTIALVAAFGAIGHGQPPAPTPEGMPGTGPGAALANARPTFLAHVALDHANGLYREGQTLGVRFAAERDAYLYLLYHQADGACVLLFPNPVRPDGRVPARQEVPIPGPGEAFRFRIRPPFGDEALQVLAASQPLPALDRLTGQRRSPLVPPDVLNALRQQLAGATGPWAEHRVPIRTVPATDQVPGRPPARAGLFIGIGTYLHPELARTHDELRHSAEVMHERLLRRGGLDPARTRLLLDRQATWASIEEAIARWLPSVTAAGDTVFLYFSGHAGQSPNRDGTEPDGQDELLGPYDLDAGTPGMPVAARLARFRDSSIVDDTLARWLEGLSGRHVVLILDTCHSGGVVEGKSLEHPFADESSRIKDIAQMDTVILSSCAGDEQTLFEGTPNRTMWFTYFLAEAVVRLDAPVTVQAAFDYSQKGLKKVLEKRREVRSQEPTLTDTALLPIVLVP